MRLLALAFFTGSLWAQTPWVVLFDGLSKAGWRAPVSTGFPESSWRIDGGTIHPVPGIVMVDLWSSAAYRNFVLEFEFKFDPQANGGIKYLVQGGIALRRRENRWFRAGDSEAEPGDWYAEATNGLEFQIVDDAGEEAKDPKRRCGAMYALVAPTDPPPIGPGVFHSGRIVVQGDRIEHYLNGRRVVQITLGSPEMEAAWEACKRSDIRRMRPMAKRETPIAITHHGTQVWYRNVRIQATP
ncbi:MAG TPA: DUF1080 domain-containing protein [Bryobacteraceae bacterium]|nr:DUF1080 domain-containing protein [Bryobacteraceae bacterium]